MTFRASYSSQQFLLLPSTEGLTLEKKNRFLYQLLPTRSSVGLRRPTVQYRLYQRKVEVGMLNAMKEVLLNVLSVRPLMNIRPIAPLSSPPSRTQQVATALNTQSRRISYRMADST